MWELFDLRLESSKNLQLHPQRYIERNFVLYCRPEFLRIFLIVYHFMCINVKLFRNRGNN